MKQSINVKVGGTVSNSYTMVCDDCHNTYIGTRVVPVYCSCDNTSLYVVVLLFLQISMPFSLLSMTPHLVSFNRLKL